MEDLETRPERTNEGFSNSVLSQLRRDEGEDSKPVLKPYKDTVGKQTIGYGRNLDDVGISYTEAEMMLWNDFQFALHSVYTYLPWATKLDDPRLGVLVNMAFQMGINTLLTFHTFLGFVEAGEYGPASCAMLQSRWATQTPSRAQRLSQQMKDGIWQ